MAAPRVKMVQNPPKCPERPRIHTDSSPHMFALCIDAALVLAWSCFIIIHNSLRLADIVSIHRLAGRCFIVTFDEAELKAWWRMHRLYTLLILLSMLRLGVLIGIMAEEGEGNWYTRGEVDVELPGKLYPVFHWQGNE